MDRRRPRRARRRARARSSRSPQACGARRSAGAVTLGRVARTPLAQTSVRDALDSALIALTAAGCDTPRLDAELLLADAMGVDRAAIVVRPRPRARAGRRRGASGSTRGGARSASRSPTSSAPRASARSSWSVDPRVLIPRPETEHLVEAALELPARRAGGRRRHGLGRGGARAEGRAARPRGGRHGRQPGRAGGRARERRAARARRRAAGGRPARAGRRARSTPCSPTRPTSPTPTAARSRPTSRATSRRWRCTPARTGSSLIRRLAPAAAATRRRAARARGRLRPGGRGRRRSCATAGFADTATVADLAGIERVVVGRR